MNEIFVAAVISLGLQISRGRIKQKRVDDIDELLPLTDSMQVEALWQTVWLKTGSLFDTLDAHRQELNYRPELFVDDEFPASRKPDCPECIHDVRFPLTSHDKLGQAFPNLYG